MNIVALLGNGSSIPYHDQLAMDPLTQRVLQRFAQEPSQVAQVREALERLAEAANQSLSERTRVFEDLFGPIERLGRGLEALRDLSTVIGEAADVAATFDLAARYGEELRRRTLGTALSVVADLSQGQGQAAMGRVQALVSWLADHAGPEGVVRIFTLNYDALIDGAALEVSGRRRTTLSDMAAGWGKEPIEILPGVFVDAFPLRDDDEYPSPIILYHLHGSLQWVRHQAWVWKVEDLDRLRELGYWTAFANGQSNAEPVVILADQKERAVGRDPFAWGYRRLASALRQPDGILIAGYGFGDVPLNQVLSRLVVRSGCPVLVVDLQEDEDAYRGWVLERLATSPRVRERLQSRLRVYIQGLPEAVEELSWEQ